MISHKSSYIAPINPNNTDSITDRYGLQFFGSKYGGWTIPTSLLNEKSICYCAGCGEDISFDLELIERFGCKVYGFDPTPRAVKYVSNVAGDNPLYHFYEIGLWDNEETLKFYVPKNPHHVSHSIVNLQKTHEYIFVPVKRLSSIMSALGHEIIDLLKIDIEGAEYKVIDSIIEDKLHINIICVEYDEHHNPLDENFIDRIKSSISTLHSYGFSLVHVQDNGNYMFINNSLISEYPHNTKKFYTNKQIEKSANDPEKINDSSLNYSKSQNYNDDLHGIVNLFKFKKYIHPDDAIIDFGCGAGFLLKNLQAKYKVGIESNENARIKALKNKINAFDDINLIPDSYADVIISDNRLQHVVNPFGVLECIRTKLKNMGKAIFVVPHQGEKEGYQETDFNNHLFSWSAQTLSNLFKSAGFKVIDVDVIQHQWPPDYHQVFEEQGEVNFHNLCKMYAEKNSHYQIRIIASR